MFSDRYSDVLECCFAINEIVANDYEFEIDTKEISFDQMIPFLFPLRNIDVVKKMSIELKIYREIVTNYNNNINPNISKRIHELITIPIIEKQEYSTINNLNRSLLKNNIFQSYLTSTKRVFYRFLILRKYKDQIESDSFYDIYYSIKNFSAFLLFDDDVNDLEKDLLNNKVTILIQFLKKKHPLPLAIESILRHYFKCSNFKSQIFEDYTNQFISLYHE
jgi:hypothetical protein